MNRFQWCCVAGGAFLLAGVLGLRPDSSMATGAEAAKADAAQPPLQVVAYSSGLTGFFDPSTKTLCLYASDLKTPFMTVQVENLGEPLKIIKAPPK